ncbi:chemotaxis protein CheW [Saccharicrinis sp. 156]|uniref:chemotaxis protein CheW n=1 Tax=Saccharicrinis sp. 156 TaxID=3417574 RepID=UPI003D351042
MEDINNSYLSFKVGSETFAIHVGRVNEIREYEAPRNMPESISFMAGVIDHRDEVIPVIDTGVKFGMNPIEVTPLTCIIIIDVKRKDDISSFRMGILADAVTDVFEAVEEDFKNIHNDYSPNYIQATININEHFYLILNSDEVFSVNEIISLCKEVEEIKKQ